MSREIDERVVQMKFEKGQFEKDIQTSIYKLDELKKGLDFKDATKGFENLDRAARNTDISALGRAVEQVHLKFGMLEVFALNVMNRISDSIIGAANSAKRLVTSLTVDQITPGWEKYAQKTSSVQTIMAATAKQFSDTSVQMQVVNEQLDKLNWFTDETSYNFVDMVNNIGKFTSNNIALDQSVTAMQGIANWAAISGANAQEASRAMYNLAQALATGSVKLIDWKSIENANMATTEFKQTVIDIATEMGTLKKVGEDLWTTLDGKTNVSVANFNEGLSKGWFTNDVLMKGLNKYGAAAEKLNEIYETLGAEVTTSRIVSSINKYTEALANARAEAEKDQLAAEETAQKVSEAGKVVAEEVADSWGVSLEEATEMLAQFDDETMQFGLKAFKAAQEAKTFQEAIDSVKDAVSTGWMKSFEYIFGDYTHAKELWTNLANTLYDIFATSGDARNEMLSTWAEWGGQKYITDTIYAGLAAIMSILAPIKAAWQATFGKMTAFKLSVLTVRLHDFVVNLVLTEDKMRKLTRVFIGVFSVLDIIKTVLVEVVKGGFKVLQRVLKELNIDIFEFAASLGDGLFEIRNWVKQSKGIEKIFDGIGNALVWVIQKAREFITAIEEFGPVKALIEGLRTTFGQDFQGIGGILQALGGIILWLWDKITSFKLPTSLEDVKQFFKDFGQSIRDNFEEIGVDFTWLDGVFSNVAASIQRALGLVNASFNSAKQTVGGTVSYLNYLFKDVDWAGVLLAAFGVGTLAVLWKFADALATIAKGFKNITGVGESAKGALDAIKGYFKALKENMKTNNMLKVAIALTALAVAFGLFARLSWSDVVKGAGAMVGIGVAVAALTFAFGRMNEVGINGKGITKLMLSLAASIALLALALQAIPTDDSLSDRVMTLFEVIGILTLAISTLAVFTKGSQIQMAGLLGFAGSIFILIQAMKSIGNEDVGAIYAAVPVVATLMIVLAAISKLATVAKSVTTEIGDQKTIVKNGGAFANMIGAVLGIVLLIQMIKQLSKMDPGAAVKGILLTIPVIGLLALLFKATSLAGKSASSAGVMILAIAAGLAILIPVVKGFASMNDGIILKGGAAITAIITYILVPLITASQFAGQYAAKAGLMLLEVAGALMVIQLVIKTLGKLDLPTLIKGVAAVDAVIVALGFVVKSMQNLGQVNEQTVKTFTMILAIVGVLSLTIVALSILNPTGALVASAGLTAVFVALGYLFKQIDQVKLPDISKMGVMIGMIGMIGLVIGLISLIGDWKSILATCAGMSLVFVSVASIAQIIKKSATSDALLSKLIILRRFAMYMSLVIAALAGVTLIYTKVFGGNVTDLLIVTTAMSEIVLAFGIMGKLIGKLSLPEARKLNQLAIFAAEMSAIMAGIAIAIGLMNAAGLSSDMGQLLLFTTALSELIISMSVALRLMSGIRTPENVIGQIVSMGVIFSILSSVLAILAPIITKYDMRQMLLFTTGISEVLIALGISAAIMGVSKFNMSITQIGPLTLLVAGIGVVLGIFSRMTDPNTVLPLATGMSLVLLAVSAAALILSKVKSGSFAGAMEGIGIALVFVTGMATLMGLIGVIAKDAAIFETASDIMIQIGRGIGGFIGGIVGGLIEGVASGFPGICSMISQGMENLMPFFDCLHQMPGGVLELVGTLLAIVGALTAAQFISGLKVLPGIGQLLMLGSVTLVSDFALFGAALAAFYNEIKDIDADKVAKAAEAVVALGTMESSMASLGSIFSSLLGFDNFDKFSERLTKLGEALVEFADVTAGLDTDVVSRATTCADTLIALEKELDPKGGLLNLLFNGEDDLAYFAERIIAFGNAMHIFSFYMKTVDVNAVNQTTACAKALVGLESEIAPAYVKWSAAGLIFGSKSIEEFGKRLTGFGDYLVQFSNSVTGLRPLDFVNVVQVTKKLVEIENSLNVQGGAKAFWFGDSSFKSFGNNLSSFGSSLISFSDKIGFVNFDRLYNAVNYIRDLVGLQDLKFTQDDAIKAAETILSDIKTTFDNNQTAIKGKGTTTVYWIVEGMRMGTNTYHYLVQSAAIKMANEFIEAFEAALGIASPSLVMNEEGHWIVKGLAEGINEETSAEEAAQKKAQNLVSAFESELSKLTSKEKTSNLEFQLWQLTDGKNASQVEIAKKQLELENEKLANLAKTVGARKAAMNAIAEISGESSKEYQEAYQEYLQAQIDMLNQQQSIDQTYGNAASNSDASLREQMKSFQEFIKENQEIYEFLGKSQEELELAAYKSAYGLDAEQVARKKAYEQYMSEYQETFEFMGKTRDELDAFAKEKSGWEGISQNAAAAMSDTTKIIADNIESYSLDMQATIEMATAEAIENATKSKKTGGSSAASSAAAAGAAGLADTFTESMFNGIQNGMADGSEVTVDYGQQLMEWAGNFLADPSQLLGDGLASYVAKAYIEKLESSQITVENALYDYLLKPGLDTLEKYKKAAAEAGVNTGNGYAVGLSDKDILTKTRQASTNIASTAISTIQTVTDSHSPSRVAMALGNYFTQGYAIGLTRNLSSIASAINEVADTVIDPLSYAAEAIDNIINTDEDLQPVITPVLDLDELKKQASNIPGLLNKDRSISVDSARLRVAEINASKAIKANQNGSKAAAAQTNYNFTQNNYSPKALSRAEIYRQTNNQFSRIREASKR